MRLSSLALGAVGVDPADAHRSEPGDRQRQRPRAGHLHRLGLREPVLMAHRVRDSHSAGRYVLPQSGRTRGRARGERTERCRFHAEDIDEDAIHLNPARIHGNCRRDSAQTAQRTDEGRGKRLPGHHEHVSLKQPRQRTRPGSRHRRQQLGRYRRRAGQRSGPQPPAAIRPATRSGDRAHRRAEVRRSAIGSPLR